MPFNKKPLGLPAILTLIFAVTLSCAKAGDAAASGVAAPNANFSAAGATIDGDRKVVVSGTATTPLSGAFGAQIDGSDAMGEGPSRGGIAAHVFQRDPAKDLVGVTAMWGGVGDKNIYRLGAEGEAYLDKFTLRLAGGWQNEGNNSTAYGNTKLSFYATDNLVFALEGGAYSDKRSGGMNVEWKPDAAYPFSVFATGGASSNSDGYGLLGIRASLGDNNASLKDRHRKYDPPNIVDTFTTNESGSVSTSVSTSVNTPVSCNYLPVIDGFCPAPPPGCPAICFN